MQPFASPSLPWQGFLRESIGFRSRFSAIVAFLLRCSAALIYYALTDVALLSITVF